MKHVKLDRKKITIAAICLVLFLLIVFTIIHILVPMESTYGDRLNNIVSIDEATMSKIKSEIVETGLVNKVEYNTNVKVIKYFVDTDSKVDDVKKIADIILNDLSEKVTTTYDIEIYVTNAKDTTNFPLIGYHSKSGSEFIWTLNEMGEDSEE